MTNWTVWKEEKNYQRLFWSGVINGVGNRFTQVAVLALLFDITGNGTAIGILFAIRMAPFLLFAPFGGMLADRVSKRNLLVIIDLLRVPLAIAPIFVHGVDDLWIIYFSAFGLATGEALYSPTRMATIPILVRQDKLLHINAIEQIMLGIVLVFGSISGGVISFLFGMHVPFILDGLTFILSAFLLLKMDIPVLFNKRTKTGSTNKQTKKFIFTSSIILITFLIIEFTIPLANGIDNVLMSVYALDVFNMGDLGVGLIYGALGLGFIISSSFANMLRNKLIPLIIIFIALEGFGHIILSSVPAFSYALLTAVFITSVGGMSNICLSTLIMKVVPKTKQGSFFGLTQMISNTSLGISMGATGLLLELFHPRTLSFIVGITYILFTCLYASLFLKINLKREKRNLARNW